MNVKVVVIYEKNNLFYFKMIFIYYEDTQYLVHIKL